MSDYKERQLLVNYILGICTRREEKDIRRWLDLKEANVRLLEQVARDLYKTKSYEVPDRDEIKYKVFQRIRSSQSPDDGVTLLAQSTIASRQRQISSKRNTEAYLKVAALFLVFLLAGVSGFYWLEPFSTETQTEEVARAEPVIKTSAVSYGEIVSLQFSDGTRITVNGGSTLHYPDSFADDVREVYLEGEAFFDIKRDESRPFVVHAGNTTTKVLGTSFNIRAFKDQGEFHIAVKGGKVAVTGAEIGFQENDLKKGVELEKNQWLKYQSSGGVLEKGEGDISDMIAWKDRILIFRNQTFGQVVELLERWYGVSIEVEDEELKSYLLEGEHMDASLEEVLKSIQFVIGFDYEIDGDHVTLRRK
ncbi:MAG: FecR domain-containing protein [Balneolaceae bacterium]